MKLLASIFLFASLQVWAAPFNLGSSDTLIFANEAIQSTDRSPDGTILVSSVGDDLHIEFEVGFAITSSSRFLRIDIEECLFCCGVACIRYCDECQLHQCTVSGGRD